MFGRSRQQIVLFSVVFAGTVAVPANITYKEPSKVMALRLHVLIFTGSQMYANSMILPFLDWYFLCTPQLSDLGIEFNRVKHCFKMSFFKMLFLFGGAYLSGREPIY